MRLPEQVDIEDVEQDLEILEYFEDGVSDWDDLAPIYDGSTLQLVADCPRKFQLRGHEGLTSPETPRKMAAGSAIHAALDYYYAHKERTPDLEEKAIQLFRQSWRESGAPETPIEKKTKHVTEDHLVQVLENYFDTWERNRIDVYSPLFHVTPDELDMSNVRAARFRLTPDGHVIFGESSLVMTFEVNGEELQLAGKPDLPVRDQQGKVYVMDHKTTSSYLSDWYFQKYDVSNKLRGYMAMMESLLDIEVDDAVVNGIYVGKYATNPDSSATKFQRYECEFQAGHVEEALRNQLHWQKTIEFYEEQGYWPQGCGFGGCAFPDICNAKPADRGKKMADNYERGRKKFQDI